MLHTRAKRLQLEGTLILPRRLCSAVMCETRRYSRLTSCTVGMPPPLPRPNDELNCTGCSTQTPASCSAAFQLGPYRIADFTIQPNKNNSFYYSAEYE